MIGAFVFVFLALMAMAWATDIFVEIRDDLREHGWQGLYPWGRKAIGFMFGILIFYVLIPVMVVATLQFVWPKWQVGWQAGWIFLLAMVAIITLFFFVVSHPVMKRLEDWIEGKRQD